MIRTQRRPLLPPADVPVFGPQRRAETRPAQALVVHPVRRGADGIRSEEARLEEAIGLARAIRLDVVAAIPVPIRQIRPATLFGGGKLDELKAEVAARDVELVVVNGPLTPIQQRNLERTLKTKVIDRTGLILEIFGERAKTSEGRLQVELAALSYQRSRLVRSWTHLERQRGGFGFMGGPGEAQIELDRRRIDERITRLRTELEGVARTRGLHRSARSRVPYPVVALVGYTNAGKSTLFNRMTGAEVSAQDQLFATLDPTMRLVRLTGGPEVILSDTVGFVADLPTDLVAAFRATLEEVRSADVVLHVRDIAHPDSEAQRDDVVAVLEGLGLDLEQREARLVEFWNKIDLIGPDERARLQREAGRRDDVVIGSALDGEGMADLLKLIEHRLTHAQAVLDLEIDAADGARLAWLYRHGTVLDRVDDAGRTRVKVALSDDQKARMEHRFDRAPGHS